MIFKARSGEGKLIVEGCAVICGQDLAVTILGGEKHHIGATALAIPRPSLQDASRISASASVICVTGHKDDELARRIALYIAANCNCVVTVVAGIHINHATAAEIERLMENCNNVVETLMREMQTSP